MYLLDTNVISEIIKKEPDQKVIAWFESINIQNVFLSVITLGEIRRGAEKLQDNFRKHKIQNWLEQDLLNKFYGRIIEVDASVADKWGYITAMRNIPAIDALIAASALVHNCKLVTRNVKDFEAIIGLEIINPWQ